MPVTTELLSGQFMYVTRYAGPAAMHPDRRRWQVTIPREYVQVDVDKLPALIAELEAAALILRGDSET